MVGMKSLSLKESILPQPSSFQKKKNYDTHGVLGTGSFGKVMVRVHAGGWSLYLTDTLFSERPGTFLLVRYQLHSEVPRRPLVHQLCTPMAIRRCSDQTPFLENIALLAV